MIGFIEEYINKKGIVVEHPGTLEQQLDAILAYAETCEKDCEIAEAKLEAAKEALRYIAKSTPVYAPDENIIIAQTALKKLEAE